MKLFVIGLAPALDRIDFGPQCADLRAQHARVAAVAVMVEQGDRQLAGDVECGGDFGQPAGALDRAVDGAWGEG